MDEKSKVWVALGDRTRLLDLIRGVGREWGGELVPFESLYTAQNDIAQNGLAFVWESEDHARVELPALVVGNDEQLNDLLAWVAAYMRPLSPLTSLVNIVTANELRGIFAKRSPVDTALLQASVGVVLAAAWMDIQKSDLPSPNPSVVILSPVFTLARAGGAEIEDVVHRWNIASELLGAVRTAVPIEVAARVFGGLRSEPNSALFGGALVGPADDLFASGSSSVDEAVRLIRGLPSEDRVRFFDQVAPTLAGSESKRNAARALAALAAACNPGDFETIRLLKPYAAANPEAVLWFGAFQALASRGSTFSAFEGLGWRVWRDLQPRSGVLDRPTCDIAYRELRILSRSKSRSGVKGFLQGIRSRAVVQLSPGANAAFRLREPFPRASQQLAGHSLEKESSSQLGITAMFDRISKDLFSLRTEMAEMRAGISGAKTKRKPEKK